MTVRRSHEIAHAVKDTVRAQLPAVSDVLVHIEPARSPARPAREDCDPTCVPGRPPHGDGAGLRSQHSGNGWRAIPIPGHRDATTLNHKLLMGYQGWFSCPGDVRRRTDGALVPG